MKLILLAHQDDEIFMLPFIYYPDPKLIIYLTSGVSKTASIKEKLARHHESKNIYDKFLKKHNIRIV